MALRHQVGNNHCVTMELLDEPIYRVAVYPYSNNKCGHYITEMFYPCDIENRKRAEKTFKRYVRKYCSTK